MVPGTACLSSPQRMIVILGNSSDWYNAYYAVRYRRNRKTVTILYIIGFINTAVYSLALLRVSTFSDRAQFLFGFTRTFPCAVYLLKHTRAHCLVMPLPDVRRSPFTEMGLCKFICHFRDIIVYVSSINKITTEFDAEEASDIVDSKAADSGFRHQSLNQSISNIYSGLSSCCRR